MDQNIENKVHTEQKSNNNENNQDNISRMIEARRRKISGESPSLNLDNNEFKEVSHASMDSLIEENSSPYNNQVEEKSLNKSEEEINQLRIKIEENNKRMEENHKYSRDVSRRMSNVAKSIKELIENGELADEHGKSLLNIIHKNELKKPEGLSHEEDIKSDPFQKFYDIANPGEIQNYKAYTRDEEYIDKINAFNAFKSSASEEELAEMYSTLDEIIHNPPELVSKMMEIGNQFLNEGYRDLIKAGNLRKYMQLQKQKNSNKEKEIDSLKKKTVKYDEDNDPPTYGFERNSVEPLKVEGKKDSQFSKKDNAHAFLDKRAKRIAEQNRSQSGNYVVKR